MTTILPLRVPQTVPQLDSGATPVAMGPTVSSLANTYLSVMAGKQDNPHLIEDNPVLCSAYAAFAMKASMVLASFARIERRWGGAKLHRSPLYYALALITDPATESRWERISPEQQHAFYRLLFDAALTYRHYRQVCNELLGTDMTESLIQGQVIFTGQDAALWQQEAFTYGALHFSIHDSQRLRDMIWPAAEGSHQTFEQLDRMGYQDFEAFFKAVVDAPSDRIEEQLNKYFDWYVGLHDVLPLNGTQDVIV